MATSLISDEVIHVENNVILTTTDLIRPPQVFNYLSNNLHKFKVGSEFVLVCGIHTSEQGELKDSDHVFKFDYEAMFRQLNSEPHYNDFSPSSAQPFQLIKERNYKMGQVIEVSSKPDESKDGKYVLKDDSKAKLKKTFEEFLIKCVPIVLILASCFSFNSEICDILRSTGLLTVLNVLEERGEITNGNMFQLDPEQQEFFRIISNAVLNIKDIIVLGTYSNYFCVKYVFLFILNLFLER